MIQKKWVLSVSYGKCQKVFLELSLKSKSFLSALSNRRLAAFFLYFNKTMFTRLKIGEENHDL